jgi:hypothetical protein
MRSAVWTLLVVAPPISSGIVMPGALHFLGHRHHLVQRLGVIRPDRPMMSAIVFGLARLRIF